MQSTLKLDAFVLKACFDVFGGQAERRRYKYLVEGAEDGLYVAHSRGCGPCLRMQRRSIVTTKDADVRRREAGGFTSSQTVDNKVNCQTHRAAPSVRAARALAITSASPARV